jgi:hypothetical protein
MDFASGFTGGCLIGFLLGTATAIAVSAKRRHVLRSIPEEDMVREIKRRRFEAALERDTAQEVEAELKKE